MPDVRSVATTPSSAATSSVATSATPWTASPTRSPTGRSNATHASGATTSLNVGGSGTSRSDMGACGVKGLLFGSPLRSVQSSGAAPLLLSRVDGGSMPEETQGNDDGRTARLAA